MHSKDELFERYENARLSGAKAQTKQALRAFIDSFANLEEKAAWSRKFLENFRTRQNQPYSIRHELYADVIYPVLVEGAARNDVWSWLWLWRTRSNRFAGALTFVKEFDEPEEGILKRCYRLAPDSDEVRTEYLDHIVDYLQHSSHEWPAGILYGMDGATVEQCGQLREAVSQARTLDTKEKFAEFLSGIEDKLDAYETRLKKT